MAYQEITIKKRTRKKSTPQTAAQPKRRTTTTRTNSMPTTKPCPTCNGTGRVKA